MDLLMKLSFHSHLNVTVNSLSGFTFRSQFGEFTTCSCRVIPLPESSSHFVNWTSVTRRKIGFRDNFPWLRYPVYYFLWSGVWESLGLAVFAVWVCGCLSNWVVGRLCVSTRTLYIAIVIVRYILVQSWVRTYILHAGTNYWSIVCSLGMWFSYNGHPVFRFFKLDFDNRLKPTLIELQELTGFIRTGPLLE